MVMNDDCPRYCEFPGILTVPGMVTVLRLVILLGMVINLGIVTIPREGDQPKDGDILRICLSTFYNVAQPCIMMVLPTKHFQGLTGTDRQAGRQADKPRYWKAVASRNYSISLHPST